MVTNLRANQLTLVLRSDMGGWCQVELQLDGKTFPLGADSESQIVVRLVSALSSELTHPVVGVINGVDVVLVLSLFERHATIFVSNTRGLRTFFFQNSSGEIFANGSLTDIERERWLSELSSEASRE
jgi:hypothetical protein